MGGSHRCLLEKDKMTMMALTTENLVTKAS